MKAKTDYFENKEDIITIYGDRCGNVNIPLFKAFTFYRSWIDKYVYVVILRKGLNDFMVVNELAYCDGVKNVHYKEFATKKAANSFIEKSVKKAKNEFLKKH
jgi:hypothetical protein